mgnify:FL=1|jgi:uncharacterized protein (DUF58 family)|tara:strand:+ start:2343 stop:3227 length:885 start_codon:yes stop_codon:yes gene_type:complete
MNPADLQAKVRQIEIRTRRLVSDTMVGQYQSVFKGQGMDFDEVREYQPGDEVRNIDWNVTARLNTPFVKQFVEERELTVMLLVDLSASGQFGSGAQTKQELAAEVTAVLAFAAQRNNDKVGLTLFTERVEKYVRPAKGQRHALRVVRDILHHEPAERGGDLRHALQHLQKTFRRRAVLVIISDFLDPLPDSALQQANRRHDVVAIQIIDPHEEQLPALGRMTLEDAETGEVGEINLRNEEELADFVHHRAAAQEELERQFRGMNIDHLRLRSGEPYMPELIKFFRMRLDRQRRS